jgi:hypothetical protein
MGAALQARQDLGARGADARPLGERPAHVERAFRTMEDRGGQLDDHPGAAVSAHVIPHVVGNGAARPALRGGTADEGQRRHVEGEEREQDGDEQHGTAGGRESSHLSPSQRVRTGCHGKPVS